MRNYYKGADQSTCIWGPIGFLCSSIQNHSRTLCSALHHSHCIWSHLLFHYTVVNQFHIPFSYISR